MKKQKLFRMKQLILLAFVFVQCGACNKQHFLDKKTSSDLVVPSTLSDFQALLDNDQVMGQVPALGESNSHNTWRVL